MSAVAAPSAPFFFGPPGRRLFAVHHAPPGDARRHAVVLCPPVGQEHVYAQRGLRRLAVRLAEEGFLTLRFDLTATGDSEGEPGDASIGAWREDLARAVAAVAAQTGPAPLCLVGLRLGAALVAELAAARGDVGAVVLWEPVADGAAYVRELERRHRALTERFPAPLPRRLRLAAGEALGLPLGEPLRRELLALDLRALPAAPAPNVLVVERAARAGSTLREGLERLGARVTVEGAVDESMWIDDINRVIVPEAAVGEIVRWIAETCE